MLTIYTFNFKLDYPLNYVYSKGFISLDNSTLSSNDLLGLRYTHSKNVNNNIHVKLTHSKPHIHILSANNNPAKDIMPINNIICVILIISINVKIMK